MANCYSTSSRYLRNRRLKGAEIGHVKIERDKLLRSVTFWCYYSDPVNQFELQYYLTCFDAAQMEMYCISPKYPTTRQIELDRDDPFDEKEKKYDTRAFCVLKDRSRYPSNLELFLASVIEKMQLEGNIQKYRDLQELKHDINDAMKRPKGLFRTRCVDVHQPTLGIDFQFSLSSVTP